MALDFTKPLIVVAHPDDETIACAGLLQRVPGSLVVIATDGAPPGYRFDRRFGTLTNYSELRFQEAAHALGHVRQATLRRPVRRRGSYFVDQHLFQDLPGAVGAISKMAREFCPDAVVSHAYEGGHIDHDACSFVARQIAAALSVRQFEFPLYGAERAGTRAWQQFRDVRPDGFELRLNPTELACKTRMMAEYQTQPGVFSVFDPEIERFRLASAEAFFVTACEEYAYEGRQISAQKLVEKFREFEKGGLPRASEKS